MKKVLALGSLVALVLFTSGCVEGGFGGLMGVGVEEKEQPDDLLQVKNENIDPPELSAGDKFEYSFELVNLFDVESAREVDVNLYNTGRCELTDDKGSGRDLGTVYPEATRVLEWDLEAPSNNELRSMSHTCDLMYQVDYNFNASTTADLYIMDSETDRNSDVAQVSPTTRKSRGPLKIDVEFGGTQPFRENSLVSFQVALRNAGAGELENLDYSDINIEVEGLDGFNKGDDNNGDGNCQPPAGDWSDDARFHEGQTSPILCDFQQGSIDGPIKTLTVKAEVNDYTYTLYGKNSVTVEPIRSPVS